MSRLGFGAARARAAAQRAWSQNSLRYSSGHAGCASGDMLLFAFNKTGAHALGGAVGSINAAVYKSYSRGAVTLTSPDPTAMPDIRFNLLDDERDREASDRRRPACAGAALRSARHSASAGDVSGRQLPRRAAGAAAAASPDRLGRGPRPVRQPPLLRSRALRANGVDAERLAETTRTSSPSSSSLTPSRWATSPAPAEWASDDDVDAVCDPQCRVRKVEGLRVADAAIMPTIPRANTHVPALMIGEQAAALILSGP